MAGSWPPPRRSVSPGSNTITPFRATPSITAWRRLAPLLPEELDCVVFYEKPLLKFDRLLETYLAYAPAGLQSFKLALPQWLKTKLHLPREISKSLGGRYRRRIAFVGHHESHAASAFYPSPFDEAAILTLDGVGEWDTATIGVGRGNKDHFCCAG